MATYPIFLVPLLPLLGALFNLFLGKVLWKAAFGREPSRQVVHFVAVASVAAACGVAVWLVAGPLWQAFMQWHGAGRGGILDGLYQNLYTWIEVGPLKVDLAFRLDTLSAVMILIITFIGTLIHVYSTGYMHEEPRYAAYFGYLNLFTGMMLILVLADNLPVMFIGWEGVGLCSYLLIGFWFSETPNANAGRKAFVVNRVGDFAFLIGMFLLFQAVGSLDFPDLRSDAAMTKYVAAFWGGERLAFWAGLFLFIGACGKSAQIPLYVWLPDAMAGPTPVSALIHAATMVTAGVYMIARLSFLFASSTTIMAVVAGVGALTALFAAIMAFAQTDFKKVLAYSTVSQLGFMFVGVGVGSYVAGVFHLLTHAFFKAGLFLAAGSVMHAMSGSGDIMKMGGLRKKMPYTWISFLAYWLAICGVVPFAGFFSKDEILAMAWVADGQGWLPVYGEILWVVLSVAALGTAFYMSRLYFLVFEGKTRADEETKAHIHESPASMTMPLVILAVFATLVGFIGMPHGLGLPNYLEEWLAPSIASAKFVQQYPALGESLGRAGHMGAGGVAAFMGIALVLGLVGIFAARAVYGQGPSEKVGEATSAGFGASLHRVVYNKFYVDELYEKIFVQPFRFVSKIFFEYVDRFVIDLIFVNGSAFVVQTLSRASRWVQNGLVHRYLAFVLVGAAAVFWLASGDPEADFTFESDGQNVTFRPDIGQGPGAVAPGTNIQWDLDGDGTADSAFDRTVSPTVERARVSGKKVTMWYTDPALGNTVKVEKTVVVGDAPTGGAQ